jgi:hypothetical protein
MRGENVRTGGTWLVIVGWLAFAASASAQPQVAASWTTVAGGDRTGDYVRIELGQEVGELRGERRVEGIHARSGYTTGTLARVVLSGSEPEANRTLRVHLPYGANLDLAAGDRVQVSATARRRGLGSVHEVRLTRRGQIVLLTTSRETIADVRVARGAEVSRPGAGRQWGLRIHVGRTDVETVPGGLFVTPDALLVMGSEVAYEGVRPPDAFDQRIVTIVRIAPITR